MEMISGLFSTATTYAAPAVAGDVGLNSWAATVTPAVNSGTLSALQGGLTAGQLISQVASGVGQYQTGMTNAALANVQGLQDANASDMKTLQIKQQLARQIGQARVAYAGSGVTMDGSARTTEEDFNEQAGYQLDVEAQNKRLRVVQDQLRASSYGSQATYGLLSAAGKAVATAGNYAIDIAKRG